jgi:hypothetical protein
MAKINEYDKKATPVLGDKLIGSDSESSGDTANFELTDVKATLNSGEQKFGDEAGGNYTEIKTDGTLKYRGDATVWKDMVMDLFGKRLLSTSGTVDYDYDENVITFDDDGSIETANDRVGGNQEINHEFKVGENITFKPHIHWWQQVTTGAVEPIVFTMRYRVQRNNAAKATSWTTITAEAGTADDVFDFTSEADGLYNQITRFDDMTFTCGVSDTIQIQMTRTDSEGGTVSVVFIDLHGEIDSDGSDEEYTKTT